ncbi:hypothetical protein EG329_012881 [Mollisiaceae sp. DMI_Dod_QoI]|nr:hypothetical protein EG329_012881 [Helotiales sp. DMI_Dod_QoI]
MLGHLSAVETLDSHMCQEVDIEESEGLITDSKSRQNQERKAISLQRKLIILNVLLLILSISILFQSIRNYSAQNSSNDALKRVNTFSSSTTPPASITALCITNNLTYLAPVLEQLKLNLRASTVNGSLFNDSRIIWREDPSEAVDAAWNRLATIKFFPITGSDVTKLGKDPSKTARVPEAWGIFILSVSLPLQRLPLFLKSEIIHSLTLG